MHEAKYVMRPRIMSATLAFEQHWMAELPICDDKQQGCLTRLEQMGFEISGTIPDAQRQDAASLLRDDCSCIDGHADLRPSEVRPEVLSGRLP